MKKLVYSILFILCFFNLSGQIEDELSGFKSTEKGIQILSITESERDSINNPDDGLLVYQISNPKGFYFFNGSNWKTISDNYNSSNPNQYVIKAFDQTASDENILVSDSAFVFSLDSSQTYLVKGSLEFDENGTADLTVAWGYTGTIDTISYGFPGISVSGGHITDLNESNKISIISSTRTELLLGIISSLTPGTLTFKFSPFDDGNGTKDITLRKNSFMILTKLD